MNGKEVFDRVKAEKSGVKAIFMSGYTKDLLDKKDGGEQQFDFIAKPLSPHGLLKKVRELLDSTV